MSDRNRNLLWWVCGGLTFALSATVVFAFVGRLVCTPPPSGLAAWWPGDGDAVDQAGDDDGTLVGRAAFAPGRMCGAFDFDGVNGYVDFGSNSLFDFVEGDFSVSLWARWRSLEGEQVLIEKWDNGPFRGWTLTKLNTNRLRFACGRSGGETQVNVTPADIATDQWFHVALIRSANRVTIYWNGAPLGWNWAATCDGTSFPLLLGRRSDSRGFFHNGKIDEVMILRRALSQAEIDALIVQPPASDGDADGACCDTDNCPSAPNPDQSDLDDDGWGDVCDCSPTNPGAFAAPHEIANLRCTDATALAWDSDAANSGAATVYDLMSGALGQWPVATGGVEQVCVAAGSSDLTAEDTRSVDPPDPGFYYLVRGRNVCAAGTYGRTSSGAERTSSACP